MWGNLIKLAPKIILKVYPLSPLCFYKLSQFGGETFVTNQSAHPLLPAGKHKLTLDELKQLAVTPFGSSQTRNDLFDDLKTLIKSLSASSISCELWIDGSFLTEKHDPADIDLTIVIARSDFDTMPPETRNQVIMICNKRHPLNASLDCYLVDSADSSRLNYWDGMWGSCRNNLPKGYIILELPVPNV